MTVSTVMTFNSYRLYMGLQHFTTPIQMRSNKVIDYRHIITDHLNGVIKQLQLSRAILVAGKTSKNNGFSIKPRFMTPEYTYVR